MKKREFDIWPTCVVEENKVENTLPLNNCSYNTLWEGKFLELDWDKICSGKRLLYSHHFQRIPTTLNEKKQTLTHLSRSSPCFLAGADLMSNSKASSSFRSSAIARTCRGTVPTKDGNGNLVGISKRASQATTTGGWRTSKSRSSAKHGFELERPCPRAPPHIPSRLYTCLSPRGRKARPGCNIVLQLYKHSPLELGIFF